jgi:ribosomal subunit interface protein
VEIVVKGRHLALDVGEAFKEHCQTKLVRLERLDPRLQRLDVEIMCDAHHRRSDSKQRVELTCRTRGPVVRAEAAAADPYAAFEKAFDKLEERFRRAASRRQASHSHSHHAHVPDPAATVDVVPDPVAAAVDPPDLAADELLVEGLVVREKTHADPPMTLADALHAMELVGHDFFAFRDVETGTCSVVYRRRGYDYGVLRITSEEVAAAVA